MIRLFEIRRTKLFLEQLETRYAPATNLVVPLDINLDQFGDQIGAYQSYGPDSPATDAIFDTGASAITFAPADQEYLQIPVKIPGGAIAGGVGGIISGDISMPGTVYADGLHAVDLSSFFDLFFSGPDLVLDPETSAAASDIQAFLGTASGSPDLPTIIGTPILSPSPANLAGLAAKIDMQGYTFDILGDLAELLPEFSPGELVWQMPDLHFVQPGTAPSDGEDTTAAVYIPMGFFGDDNHLNPGDSITETHSPMQPNVGLVYQDAGPALSNKHFLFDTGAQLSILSTATAEALGIDLEHPETTITVQGVAGSLDVPGYTLKQLQVPTTDGGTITFTDVPVYILDVAPDLDGILGMNLFNTTYSMVYDPFHPDGSRLGLTFHTTPRTVVPDDDLLGLLGEDLAFLADLLGEEQMEGLDFLGSLMSGHALPIFNFNAATPTNVATTTVLTATPNASTGGTLVTFTATVSPTLVGALGSVNFLDGTSALFGGMNVPLVGGVASFQISNLSVGTHPISAVYSGATGFQPSTSTALDFAVSAAPPKLLTVTPNGNLPAMSGSPNSRVVSMVATFDQAVQIDDNAFSIVVHANDVVYGGQPKPGGYGTAPLTLTSTPSGDHKTWTITFSGNTDDGADGLKSLVDGVYDFNIDAAKIHPLVDANVSMAANSTTTIYRLFGETDPATPPAGGPGGLDFQAVVNPIDNLNFLGGFNNTAGYKPYLDFNGDGVINPGDYLEFLARFNQILKWRA